MHSSLITSSALQVIADNCPAAIFQYSISSPEGIEIPKISFISRSIENLWPGLTSDMVIENPQSLMGRIVDEDREKTRDALRTAARKGRQLEISFRINTSAGQIRWMTVSAAPHTDDNGQIHLNGVIQDTTESIRRDELYRESLRRSQEQYQKMVDEVEDYVILLLDKSGNFINWNKGAEKLKGYNRAEIIGKNFRIFYTEADRLVDKPGSLLIQANLEGKASDEGWRVKKDGSLFWASVVITALHDKDRNVVGFTKVTRDKTREKEYLNAIESQNKTLRSIAYTQSHVVRAPLSRIMGICGIIEEYQLEEHELRDFLKALKNSCRELDGLIQEISAKSNELEAGENS